MSNLAKLDFVALDITGKNYLSWALDAEIHLNAENLGDTIKEGNETTAQQKAKAMIFLRHHIHEALKIEYLTIKDPLELWTKLKERYDHLKTIILPRARYEWSHLRLQDFKTISDYNSAMFRITSQLILCGDTITDKEMLEKTYSTFHASQVLLQQQYREKGFTKYSELISCLLLAEQNNELLMKNHETRPTGTTPLPEANMTTYSGGRGRGHRYKNIRGGGHRGASHGSGRGHARGREKYRGNYHGGQFKNAKSHHKSHDNGKKSKDERNEKKNETPNACHRCGSNNHWARACRTPKHLVELYQQSMKDKGKGIETNFTHDDGNIDIPGGHKDLNNATHVSYDDFLLNTTHMDAGDFLDDTTQMDACNFPYA